MATTRVGLLVAGHIDEKFRHVSGDYPDLFRRLFEPLGIEMVRYDVDEGRFPTTVDECDGWLCSPSRLSTFDLVPWIADLEDLLRDAIAVEKPLMGICFGHQLLAQALGGTVERSEYGWGVGVRDIEVVGKKPWMDPPLDRLSLIGSHRDQVTRLPDDAELLFTAEYCPIAGFAVGERAWTSQVHPEFTAELADHLLADRIELIGAERVTQARASLTRPTSSREVSSWMGKFFVSDGRARHW